MINIAICDNNNNFCSELEKIFIQYSKKNVLPFNIDIFYSGEQLYKYLKNGNKYDIIFLDIYIGEINGLDIGLYIREQLKDETTKILYISSNEYYNLKLFEVRPFNFFIKPVSKNKILKNLDKMIKCLNVDFGIFYYKKDKLISKVYIKDILYFEGYNTNTKLITNNEEVIINNKSKDIYIKLDKHKFFYAHRSYIVNYNAISKFSTDKLIMPNNHIIPISKSRRKYLKNLNNIFEK